MPPIMTKEMFEQLQKMRCEIRFSSQDGEHCASLHDSMTKRGIDHATSWNLTDAARKVIEKHKDRPVDIDSAQALKATTKTQAEKIEQLEAELAKLKPAETRKRRRAASKTATMNANDAPDTGDPPGTPSRAD